MWPIGATTEVSNKEREKSDDFEMSLELSIGGGKYEISRGNKRENAVDNNSSPNTFRSVWPCDLQRRKGIQASRRQEARKKREEKLKKSTRVGFLEDNIYNNNEKLVFEAQKLKARVEDRGIRENNGFSEEKIRKKDKNETANDDLSLSLFTGIHSSSQQQVETMLYPRVQMLAPWNNCGVPSGAGEGETASNRSLDQTSSAVSDYQSTSHRGGSNSDTGSHSSRSPLYQYHSISDGKTVPHFEVNDSSCQTVPGRGLGGSDPAKVAPPCHPDSNWGLVSQKTKEAPTDSHFDQTNITTCSNSDDIGQTCGGGGGLHGKPVKPVCMPCVLTTGNGPNGRTVRGFLYKYTETEVIIVCVCHGSSFSPAEFVEHAGGVDISHPLRHITIVRSTL